METHTMKWPFLLSLTAVAGLAQPLQVYTELARLDASGKVLAPETPREILSPALARNAFTSFQVAVTAAKGEHWRLFVGQNPENAVAVTLYRESGERAEQLDRLERVELPAEGDGPAVFWMDVWTAKGAPLERIKIEPQLDFHGDWVIYPIEGRVMEATVPDGPWRSGVAPPVEVMRGLLCKPGESTPATEKAGAPPPAVTMARLHYRNAQQDVALAGRASRTDLTMLFGDCAAAAPDDPEWYLRLRDYLFRLR
jgi:hypothetical protein